VVEWVAAAHTAAGNQNQCPLYLAAAVVIPVEHNVRVEQSASQESWHAPDGSSFRRDAAQDYAEKEKRLLSLALPVSVTETALAVAAVCYAVPDQCVEPHSAAIARSAVYDCPHEHLQRD